MIIDDLSNLKAYIAIHPALKSIEKYLSGRNLSAYPDGRVDLEDIGGFVNVQTIPPKTADRAVWKSHKNMIDVQIPLTGDEVIGYTP